MRLLLRNILLNILGTLKKPKPGIHIINSHYVTPGVLDESRDSKTFDKFVENLNSIGEMTSIEKVIHDLIEKKWTKKNLQFILTFDDGFEECYTVIAPILEKYNCRGMFFINSNYISSDDTYQSEFQERIHLTTKKPMSWSQVIDLHKRGHTIGSHTLDHYNLAEITNEDIEIQIIKNKQILEEKLNYKCESFAWPYGRLKDFPSFALETAKKHHKYIFSSANYQYYFSENDEVINRRHLEPFWPELHVNYFLSALKK